MRHVVGIFGRTMAWFRFFFQIFRVLDQEKCTHGLLVEIIRTSLSLCLVVLIFVNSFFDFQTNMPLACYLVLQKTWLLSFDVSVFFLVATLPQRRARFPNWVQIFICHRKINQIYRFWCISAFNLPGIHFTAEERKEKKRKHSECSITNPHFLKLEKTIKGFLQYYLRLSSIS